MSNTSRTDEPINFVEAYTNALAYRHVVSTRALGGVVEETTEAIYANLSSPNPWENGVVILSEPSPESFGKIIERAQDFFGADPFTVLSAWYSDAFDHDAIELEGRPPLMVRATPAPQMDPTELVIREVTDEASIGQLDQNARLGFEGEFGMSVCKLETVNNPFRMFVGYLDNEPVSSAVATVTNGVVLIEGVATIPSARKRGFGAALTNAAANVAPELPAILTSSPQGRSVYESIGFVEVSTWTAWQHK